jgi:hypothetical protein
MNASQITPLTPEQIAAVVAGGGYARCEDPQTHVVYHLVQQGHAISIDDEYVRAKLAEAQSDIDAGRVAPWDLVEVKRELQLNAARNSPRA